MAVLAPLLLGASEREGEKRNAASEGHRGRGLVAKLPASFEGGRGGSEGEADEDVASVLLDQMLLDGALPDQLAASAQDASASKLSVRGGEMHQDRRGGGREGRGGRGGEGGSSFELRDAQLEALLATPAHRLNKVSGACPYRPEASWSQWLACALSQWLACALSQCLSLKEDWGLYQLTQIEPPGAPLPRP